MNIYYVKEIIKEIENYQYYPLLTKENIRYYLEMAYAAGYDQGRKVQSNQKPVICMDLHGQELKQFSSAAEASRILKIDHTGIVNCCNNKKQKTAGGYKWKYLN